MFNINDYDLDNWDGRGFYEYIIEQYDQAAREAGVNYADVYLNADDSNAAYFDGLQCDNRLFLELICHAQNRQGMKNVIKWDVRRRDIQNATRNFNPQAFLEYYQILANDDSIYSRDYLESHDELFSNIKNDMNLPNNKPVKNFIKYVIFYAVYIVRKYEQHNINDNECKDCFYNHYINDNECKDCFYNHLFHLHNVTKIENYLFDEITFGHNVPYGYQTALICDLLKESGNRFNYLVKPDIHINHVFKNLFGLNTLTKTHKNGKQYEVIVDNDGSKIKDCTVVDAFSSIIECIRNQGITDITAYKLDKMLFILCNDNGFYQIEYNGVTHLKNNNFTMNKETLLNHIAHNFTINHR